MSGAILVTGSHRSGTTWTGRMLCHSGSAGYIHEPFNPARKPGWLAAPVPYWFLHVGPHNEEIYGPLIERVLRFEYPVAGNLRYLKGPREIAFLAQDVPRSVVYRLRGPRPLIKDPIALFSSEWLARTFSMDVVVMVRHPAAFAGSIKRLNWQFGFRGWAAQETLLRAYLEPFREQILTYHERGVDIIDQAILMWNAMHHAIDDMRRRNPGWSLIRHEDLASAPVAGFRELYGRLGLRWNERTAAHVARYSGEHNPGEVGARRHSAIRRDSAATTRTWATRLTGDEARRVLEGTAATARRFYSEEELTGA